MLEDRTLLSAGVSTPTLSSPGPLTTDTTPTIAWTDGDEAERYELHIYSTTLGRLVYHAPDVAETAHELDTPLAAADTYQVFVRGADGLDVSRWSTPIEFELALPAAPTITGPDSRTPETTPTVTWDPSEGAAAYHLQVYSVTRGQLRYEQIGLTGTSHTLSAPLQAGETHEVFVRSINPEGAFGRWEPPHHFDVLLPESATIRGPASPTVASSATITWSPSDGAAAYDVEIYSTTRGRLGAETSGLQGTAYHIAGPLEPGETYAVYVRGVNPQGDAGQWSSYDLTTTSTSTLSTTTSVNNPPWAEDDFYQILHDTSLNEPAPGVLWNDWDDDGDPLTAVLDAGPSNAASFMLYSDGGFDYQPQAGWTGTDSFTYYASDGTDPSNLATVWIDVTNNAPWAEDDFYQILHDTTLDEPAPGVMWNDWDDDGDPIEAVLDTGPSNAVSFAFNPDGSFFYEPPAQWAGSDSFTYHVTDGIDDSNVATVWIDVTNSAPWAEDDFYQILHDTTLDEPAPGVMWNDWDDDGDPITAVLGTGPSNAVSFTFNPDGSFFYEPPAQWAGSDNFTYYVTDGIDDSNLATVWIDVTNNAPWAEDDFYTAVYNTPLVVQAPGVLENDWDDDGDPIEAVHGQPPQYGSLDYLNSDGSFQYTPPDGFTGTDQFTYFADDGIDLSNEAIVWIEVVRPQVDIDIDSNNDGWVDPEDDPTLGTDDPIEDDPNLPGQYIAVNDDDDNENLEWDLNDTALVNSLGNPLADDDLVPAYLEFEPYGPGGEEPDLTGFQLVIEASSELRLWMTQDKTGPLGNQAQWTRQSDGTWCGAFACGALPSLIYVEGYEPSAVEGAASLTLTLWNNEAVAEAIHSDRAKATAIKVDLDIDSDNTNGYDDPDRNYAEDRIENAIEDPALPGKLIPDNLGDKDGDGIPDFADGYNRDGVAGNKDDSNDQEKFTPLWLKVLEPIDLSVAKFEFVYTASDPAGVTVVGDTYTPASGGVRIWMKDGNEPRTLADYVAPGVYTATELDMGGATRERPFFVEGIRPTGSLRGEDIMVLVDPDGDGPAGFVHKDLVIATTVGIVIAEDTNNDHAPDTQVDHVHIGHWGADTVFAEGDGVNGYKADGTLRNGAGNEADGWDNFVERDPDRFYISINDPSRNRDPEVAEFFEVKLATLTSAFATDDNLTEVRVTETGADTGVFRSKPQLLMSPDLPDNPDDKHRVHDGLIGPVDDDTFGDRTHRATVDGLIRVEHGTLVSGIPVCDRNPEERKILNVQVHIFNEPYEDTNANGSYDAGEPFIDISNGAVDFDVVGVRGPIWTDAEVTRFLDYTRAYLASACIRIAEATRKTIEPTGLLFQHSRGYFDDFPDDTTGATPSRDETIIQDNFRSAVNLNASDADDIVDVYFVAPFTPAGGTYASQFRPGFVAGNGLDVHLINQVHVGLNSERDNVPSVLPHELMHQLTNRVHDPVPDHIFFPTPGFAPGDGTTVLTTRRMTTAMESDARTERPANDMTAVGNRLLREVNP